MFGVIHLWRVLPDKVSEHSEVMARILEAERLHAPEVLLCLAFGPSSDGTCAEVQVYADAPAADAFSARVQQGGAPGLAELARLWEHQARLCDPASFRSIRFEGGSGPHPLLGESFVRQAAGVGHVEGAQRLAGRVALVTGAYRGNGLGIAQALARDGADLALLDLSEEAMEPARAQIEALGRRCVTIAADVTDPAAVQRAVETTVQTLGGLDILVNNAGVFPFKPIEEFTPEEFSRVLDVNLKGPWLLTRCALPELKKRPGSASIVNITSCSGHYGGASPGGSAYDASKGGLRQLTYSLAAELGPHGIRVNAIAPGVIATEAQGGDTLQHSDWGKFEIGRTPLRRLGEAADVGTVAAFLASDAASFVTGVTVILDGGAMAAW